MEEKKTLLKKYDIPISHLDFEYVEKCTDTKELERIVLILRSGEEGYYPELTTCAEDKLKKLKPHSRVLRKEDKLLTKSCLSAEEWEEHSIPIIEWSTEIKNKDSLLLASQESPDKSTTEIDLPPIRKGGKVTSKKKKATSSPTSSAAKPDGGSTTRSSATNYREWDKYDADAELLKMNLEEERVKEHVERMNRINQEKSAKMNAVEQEANKQMYEKLTIVEREKLSEDYKIRGNEFFRSQEYKQALENYSQCIAALPSATGYNNRAITYIKLKRYIEALSDCEECLRQEPNNIKALLRKATSCQSLDRNLEAYQIYEQVKTLDPKNTLAINELEKLRAQLGEVAPSTATRIKIVDEQLKTEQPKKEEPKTKSTKESMPAPKQAPPGPQALPKKVSNIPSKLPKEPEKPPCPKPVEYDYAELIKPNKMVKSKFVKTMENLGKLVPTKDTDAKPSQEKEIKSQENTPEFKLLLEDPVYRVPQGLIQEL